jgi:hypothetical protein
LSKEGISARNLEWNDMAPSHWYGPGQEGPVWISAFLIMNSDPIQISPDPVIIDFGDARVLALYGKIPYVRLAKYEVRSTPIPEFHISPEEVTTPEGSYLLIVLPYDESDPSRSESHIRARIVEIAGLLVAVFGPNMAYQRLFDNIVKPPSYDRTIITQSFRNPASMPSPNISSTMIDRAVDAHKAMIRLPTNEKNRIVLSLRWFFEAQHESGVDIFLKLWVALEAAGMSNRNNVRSINEVLARSYRLSYEEAKQKFAVGRLFGLRSRIVHQGEIRPIHADLSDYVAALYLDVLYDHLDLTPQGFAIGVQQSKSPDLDALLK